ncbi:ParM/StbA family protein [Ahniella affigens]|nr:ParM/StbA family protein [Ahniella affigens]
MSRKVCMGLDIGYGYVKTAWTEGSGESHVHIMPSGAALASLLPADASGGRNLCGGVEVLVEGEVWVAGANPGEFQASVRQLHADYAATNEYLALAYAAIIKSGQQVVDELVTGLPMSHYLDPERRARLVKRLTGKHPVRGGRTVTVERVSVVPQPMGAVFLVLGSAGSGRMDRELVSRIAGQATCTLSIDPGFYSTDYVVVKNRGIRDRSAGTSTVAISAVLDETGKRIAARYQGVRVSRERLELALRDGTKDLLVGKFTIPFREILADAAAELGRRLSVEILESIRGEEAVDVVLLSGGGSALFDEQLRGAFPNALVHVVESPQLANARGFLARARAAAGVS